MPKVKVRYVGATPAVSELAQKFYLWVNDNDILSDESDLFSDTDNGESDRELHNTLFEELPESDSDSDYNTQPQISTRMLPPRKRVRLGRQKRLITDDSETDSESDLFSVTDNDESDRELYNLLFLSKK